MASTDERSDQAANRVCVGVVVRVRGLTGEVCIKSFTAEPTDVACYGPVSNETGCRQYRPRVMGYSRGLVIARIEGVEDRSAAEALCGEKLYIPRAALPEPEDEEYYHVDLLGLQAELAGREGTDEPLGRVCAVHDFGAGAMLEIEDSGGGVLVVPFTRAAVPIVDIPGGRVVIAPLAGLLKDADRATNPDDEDAL